MPVCDCGAVRQTQGQLDIHIEVAHLIPLEREQVDLSHRQNPLLLQITDRVARVAQDHERKSPMRRRRSVR